MDDLDPTPPKLAQQPTPVADDPAGRPARRRPGAAPHAAAGALRHKLRAARAALAIAERRAEELAKANQALRQGIDRVNEYGGLDGCLSALLFAATDVFAADAAAMMLRQGDSTSFRPAAAVFDGRACSAEEIAADPYLGIYAAVSGRDPCGIFSGVIREPRSELVFGEWLLDVFPEAYDFHVRRHGHRVCWQFPLMAGDRMVGFLALAMCEPAPPTGVQIESVAAVAQQMVLALELTRLAGQAQATAVAGERERAAEGRCAELARANEVIRAFGREVVALRSADDILGHFIRRVAVVTQADGASAQRRIDLAGTEFAFATSYDRKVDAILPPDELFGHEVVDEYWRVSREDPHGFFAPLAAGRDMLRTPADTAAGGLLRFHDFLASRFVEKLYEVPYRVGGEVAGYVGLAFSEGREPSPVEREVVAALATQAGVALELTRAAEQAKAAAVAREREAAAARRIAELERTNAALQRVLDALTADASLDHALGRILLTVAELIESDYAALWLLEPATQQLHLRLVCDRGAIVPGQDSGHPNASTPIRFDDPQLAEANDRTRAGPHWIDPRDEQVFTPAHRAALAAAGVRRLLRIGLVVGAETVGIVTVRHSAANAPSPERVGAARTLSQQAALAVYLDRLAAAGRHAAVADERNRMAREMHDTLAQCFTGIFIQLQAAGELAAAQPAVARDCIRRAEGLARDGLREARRSVAALQPDADEYADLPAALRRLIGQATPATSIRSGVRVHGLEYPLPADVGLNLYRVAQEALGNAQRYAAARHVRLRVGYEPEAVTLAVADDGRGFDPAAVSADAGFGLAGMRHRAERLGGTFLLTTAPGGGTEIQVRVPLTHPTHRRP